MNLFDKFTNPNYIKKFNYFLKKVVEPTFNEKYKKNYSGKFDFSLYGIDIKPKEPYTPGDDFYDYDPAELAVTFFIDSTPNEISQNFFLEMIFNRGEKILDFGFDNYFGLGRTFGVNFLFNKRSLNPITYVADNNIQEKVNPSERAIKNICDSEKFCKAQGKITFGQLKAIFESATRKRIFTHLGEGGYKATLRLLPWFLPQLLLVGAAASITRAVNKIVRPALEDTQKYKTWWGKMVLKAFDVFEGELNIVDPLSKIFFISDGLLVMVRENDKIQFARHIADIANNKPEDEEVPEYFVENELRNWLNEKYLLDPKLETKSKKQDDLPFDEVNESDVKRRTFKSGINEHELKWHFDERDRKVKVVKSDGWFLQMDNDLPTQLNEGQTIFIPKGVYHRVIKGDGELIVKIKEF
jgi:hypothetical protein